MLHYRSNLPRSQCLVPWKWDDEHLQCRAIAAALHRTKAVQPLAAGGPTHPMERNGRHGRPKLRHILFLNSRVPQLSNLPAINRAGRRRRPARHHWIPRHPPSSLPGRSHAMAHCRCATETRPLHHLDRTHRPSLPGRGLQQFLRTRLRAYRYPHNLLARRERSN